MLAQAETLLAQGGSDEAAFALRETERRYLPDTLRAYEDIPPARRDAPAAEMLVEQLRLLERATAQRLAVLAESAETALQANGAFLAERFGPLEALPQTPPVDFVDPDTAPPTVLVRRLLERLEAESGSQPIAHPRARGGAARRRVPAPSPRCGAAACSGAGRSKRSRSTSRGVTTCCATRSCARAQAGVEATVTRYLRGIKNKTVTVDVGEWTRGLIADLAAYVERERGARETLTRLFRENR